MNNEIRIKYRSKPVFDLALTLAFTDEYDDGRTCTCEGYRIVNDTIYLFRYSHDKKDAGYIPFPYKLKLHEVIPFVWGWLEQATPTERQPDTDGSVEKGFTISTDGCDWRGGSGFWGSFISIKPSWIVYGK